MNRNTLRMLCLSYFLFLNILSGADKRKEYNVAEFEADQQRIKSVMEQVLKASEGKTPSGHNGITTVQHVEGNKYLVRRGEMPVEAAIIHDAKTTLVDGTHLFGYIFSTGETFTYTTITGAKATVKQSDFHNSNYPFESVANFVQTLKTGVSFYCFGSPSDCVECTGWGKTKAKTQTGWKECTYFKGKGKVTVRYDVVWKELKRLHETEP
jgi:hypothetical protein